MAATAAHAAGMLGSCRSVWAPAHRTTTVPWLCCLASCERMTTGGAESASSDALGRASIDVALQEDAERFTGAAPRKSKGNREGRPSASA